MIGEALAVASSDLGDDVVARIGGALGDDIRAARAELAKLSPEARKSRRALWAAAARTPMPPGFRGVHGSWIEAMLEDMPPRCRTDLASGGGDPVGVWLVRRACASIPPMEPVALVTHVTDLDAVLALPGPALESWLENVGAEQVAVLAIYSRTVELVQRRPGPVGDRLRAAVARVFPFFRKDLLGYPIAHVAKRCADTPLEGRGLLRIGARTIAPHVATRATAAEQIAHRLPRALGLVVASELRAHATASIDSAPTWRVLQSVSVAP